MVRPTHVLVGYPISFCHDAQPDPSALLKRLGYPAPTANTATCSFMAIVTDPAIHFFNHAGASNVPRQLVREMEARAAGIMRYAFEPEHDAEACVQQYLEQQALLAAPLSSHIITCLDNNHVYQRRCGDGFGGADVGPSRRYAPPVHPTKTFRNATWTEAEPCYNRACLHTVGNALPSQGNCHRASFDPGTDYSWLVPAEMQHKQSDGSSNIAEDMQDSITGRSQWADDPGSDMDSMSYTNDGLNSEYGYYDGVLEWLLVNVQNASLRNAGRDAWSKMYGLAQPIQRESGQHTDHSPSADAVPRFDHENFPALAPAKQTILHPPSAPPSSSTALDFAAIVRRNAHGSSNSTAAASTIGAAPARSASFSKIRSWLSSSYDPLIRQLNRPARIPWLETGDPVTQMYRTERRHAHQCWAQMRYYYQIAQKCYRRQDWANARWYAQEARSYRTRMKELHHQASRRIFAQRNQADALFIDLHGMHVDEAHASTLQWFNTMLRDGYRGIVYVVTGIGHHSRPLRQKQQQQQQQLSSGSNGKLRPAVELFLKSMYRCEETSVYGDDKGGVFAVYLCAHRFIPSALRNRRLCFHCKFEQEI